MQAPTDHLFKLSCQFSRTVIGRGDGFRAGATVTEHCETFRNSRAQGVLLRPTLAVCNPPAAVKAELDRVQGGQEAVVKAPRRPGEPGHRRWRAARL